MFASKAKGLALDALTIQLWSSLQAMQPSLYKLKTYKKEVNVLYKTSAVCQTISNANASLIAVVYPKTQLLSVKC